MLKLGKQTGLPNDETRVRRFSRPTCHAVLERMEHVVNRACRLYLYAGGRGSTKLWMFLTEQDDF
jgi:hypothetical protein